MPGPVAPPAEWFIAHHVGEWAVAVVAVLAVLLIVRFVRKRRK